MLKGFLVFSLAMSLIACATVFQATAAEGPSLQMFDREACYSNCPCGFSGAEQLCMDCKQKCDERFWDEFDKEEAADSQ